MTSRGGGLASRPRTYFPGFEKKGANRRGQPGGARVIACAAGQGSSGEWVPGDGAARDAFPQPGLRKDGGLTSYATVTAPILGGT